MHIIECAAINAYPKIYKQQTKLLLYSYFIIAVNQMLFSYLDYLYEKTTGKKVEGYDYNCCIIWLGDPSLFSFLSIR